MVLKVGFPDEQLRESPGKLFEMQMLRLLPRLLESETGGGGPACLLRPAFQVILMHRQNGEPLRYPGRSVGLESWLCPCWLCGLGQMTNGLLGDLVFPSA